LSQDILTGKVDTIMGFTFQGLGPADQRALAEVWPRMIQTLRIGAAAIQGRPFRIRSRVWFGDISPEWMQALQNRLLRMATIANTQQFEVSGMQYTQRDSGVAAHAVEPPSGWGTYTDIRKAQGTQFRIKLDIGWNRLPTFRSTAVPAKSKFQTIVHEVSHLVLHTRDLAYGGPGGRHCKDLALTSPTDAKDNADNWAFFVDDVRSQVLHRPPDPVPCAVWKTYTARSWHTRSGDLRNLDDALARFEAERNKSAESRRALILAFRRWHQRNRKEREKRNAMNIVNRLRNYVDAMELNEV
jgi:hypothetical protein